MKRWSIISGITIILGVVLAQIPSWRFSTQIGRSRTQQIVERLSSPIAITNVTEAGFVTTDGKLLPLPGVAKVFAPASVAKDVLEHGVEMDADGTLYALVRVHHWCGNDPVAFHLGRVDLSSLLLVLGEFEESSTSQYGIDPWLFSMARYPHNEVEDLWRPAAATNE